MSINQKMIGAGSLVLQLGCVVLLLALCPDESSAADGFDTRERSWYVQVGGYWHFHDDEDYVGTPIFAGIEYNRSNSRVFGFSVFDNSFGDFSQYLYLGKSYYPLRSYPRFRIKLTAGITHGYKGEHKDISPIHWGDAWAFGIIPGLGYQGDRVGVDVALLGNSGLLFLLGYHF